jgi:hypothetical protein
MIRRVRLGKASRTAPRHLCPWRMNWLSNTFLLTMNYAALCFNKNGLRTVGRPLYDESELMPVFGHVGIRKQRLSVIFVCYVCGSEGTDKIQRRLTSIVLMKTTLPRDTVIQLLRNIGCHNRLRDDLVCFLGYNRVRTSRRPPETSISV